MHLVQVLLPLFDNKGRRFPKQILDEIAGDFTERFGGLTAYTRSPAEGRWKQGSSTNHDDVVVLEIMVQNIDRAWWSRTRAELERQFQQEVIVIRSQAIELL